jgi:hypothetical protein
MKVFNLSCESDHAFEGWFASLEEFDRQRDSHLLRCPLCDSGSVRRLPSASRLNFGSASSPAIAPALEATKALLQQFKKMVDDSENVGDRFAEEARRIHYRETAARNIRGVASQSERAELAEEGIEVFTLATPIGNKESLQ